MNFYRMMGVLLTCMIFIKLVADNVMPQLLLQVAQVGGTLSRGTRDIFKAV